MTVRASGQRAVLSRGAVGDSPHAASRPRAAAALLRAARFAPALLLALAVGGQGCAKCDGDEVCAVGDELPWGLLSVLALAAADVFVVGSSASPDATTTPSPGPAALHWDGAAWSRFDTAEWDGIELWWVWAAQDDAVFVGTEGTILELDRASGEITQVPGLDPETTFFGVWGASADDLWAVGQTLAGSGPPALWRRQAGQWAPWEDPTFGPGEDGQVWFKVHGASADDLWIVGSRGAALHWDGAALSAVPTDADVDTSNAPLLTVDAGGDRPIAVGGVGNGLILEWDGAAWRDNSPEFQPGFNGVCTLDGEEPVAVGQAAARVHRADAGWEPDLDRGIEVFTRRDWHSCDIGPDGSLWTVGGKISSRPLGSGVVGYTGPGSPDAIDGSL